MSTATKSVSVKPLGIIDGKSIRSPIKIQALTCVKGCFNSLLTSLGIKNDNLVVR